MGLLQSFEDCPNHCVNGEYVDRVLRKKIRCQYCANKRAELVKQGIAISDEGTLSTLSSLLGVKSEYMKAIFSYDAVVPDGERLYIESDSIDTQKKVSEELYSDIVTGFKPKKSLCFGLGNKGRVDRFAYPMLAKAYQSGLSISRFISCDEYNRLKIELNEELDDFYSSDIVIMLISDGASKADIAAAKGLMQIRASKGNPTIFLTTWTIEACSTLLGYWNDPSLYSATPVFLEYRSSKGKHTKYINDLTGVENGSVDDNEVIDLSEMTAPKKRSGVELKDLINI